MRKSEALGVIFLYSLERLVRNLESAVDILILKRSVDEVVMMAGKINTSAYHFLNPVLMKEQRIVVCNSKVEQRGLAGHNEVKSVLLSGLLKTVGEFETLFSEHLRCVKSLHLIDTGDTCGKRNCAHPV